MSREFASGVKFTDIPSQSTSSLWGDESDQPAELDITEYGLARVLSRDDTSGAMSLLIKEPPGWIQRPQRHTQFIKKTSCSKATAGTAKNTSKALLISVSLPGTFMDRFTPKPVLCGSSRSTVPLMSLTATKFGSRICRGLSAVTAEPNTDPHR